MKARTYIALVGAVVAWPLTVLCILVLAPFVFVFALLRALWNMFVACNYDMRRFMKLAWLTLGSVWFNVSHISLFVRIAWYYYVVARFDGVTIDIDATGNGLFMDIYAPHRESAEGPRTRSVAPVILFVHGGAWAWGNKRDYALLARTLTRTTHSVVCVLSYPYYPKGRMVDMASAYHDQLVWVKKNISRYGGDPKNITTVGHSAGAHIIVWHAVRRAAAIVNANLPVAVLGRGSDHPPAPIMGKWKTPTQCPTCPSAETRHYANAPSVQRIVVLSGVFNLNEHYAHETARAVECVSPMRGATGGYWDAMSPSVLLRALVAAHPTCNFSAHLPPLRLIHGRMDETVSVSQSREMMMAYLDAGCDDVEMKTIDCDHTTPVLCFMADPKSLYHKSIHDTILQTLSATSAAVTPRDSS
jgi:acetyl esterase/lipase